MAQTSLIMHMLAASIQVANRAGFIIRDVMSKGELGIVEKVRVTPTVSMPVSIKATD